jgi:hypothetical protein
VGKYPSQERLLSLFDYDPESGRLVWKVRRGSMRTGAVAGTPNHDGYLRVKIDGKQVYLAHRVIFKMVTGSIPEKIDHKDLNRANNAWANLRPATNPQNGANQGIRRNNSTGFKGVCFNKARGKYQADIRAADKGIKLYLGLFATPEEAHKAYCAAANTLHGEFANHG